MSILTRSKRLNQNPTPTTDPDRTAPRPTIAEAPERGEKRTEAPDSGRSRRTEAPDAGIGRGHTTMDHEFTHGRSQS